MVFRSFSAALNAVVNPDNVKASVRLYMCGSDGRIIIECSMKWLLDCFKIACFRLISLERTSISSTKRKKKVVVQVVFSIAYKSISASYSDQNPHQISTGSYFRHSLLSESEF